MNTCSKTETIGLLYYNYRSIYLNLTCFISQLNHVHDNILFSISIDLYIYQSCLLLLPPEVGQPKTGCCPQFSQGPPPGNIYKGQVGWPPGGAWQLVINPAS